MNEFTVGDAADSNRELNWWIRIWCDYVYTYQIKGEVALQDIYTLILLPEKEIV